MIDREHELPFSRRAKLLNLSQSSFCYKGRSVTSTNLAVMRLIHELHSAQPFARGRMLRDPLRGDGVSLGRDRIAEAPASIGRYLKFYNRKRPNSSLDARTPDQAYFNHLPMATAA